ncbi:MAG: GDSL-type esterase/lipase family protein [Hyphomicrobiaceae bacterium]
MIALVKALSGRLMLLGGSLIATFLVLEFGVFSYILKPDDVLHNVTINGVIRYEPGAKATFRHPDGSETSVTINADGWNSTKPYYELDKRPGTLRLAVIGDSYVHGAFIDTKDGFPEIVEHELNQAGINSEVYRFGMDGAPLSQYLQMLRHEVLPFKPDIAVVQLIHNDFDESYRFIGTRYSSSFLKINVDDAGRFTEVEPTPFEPGWPDLLRELKTFRYLYYETNAYLKLKSLVSQYVWGEEVLFSPEFISSAVDIRNLEEMDKIRFVTRYVMHEMKQLADANGIRLLFVMDGVREAIYDGKPRSAYKVAELNDLARQTADELGLPFLDLQQAFADDYAASKKRLEFDFDWHWNRRANALAGKAIANAIRTEPSLLGHTAVGSVSDPPAP